MFNSHKCLGVIIWVVNQDSGYGFNLLSWRTYFLELFLISPSLSPFGHSSTRLIHSILEAFGVIPLQWVDIAFLFFNPNTTFIDDLDKLEHSGS